MHSKLSIRLLGAIALLVIVSGIYAAEILGEWNSTVLVVVGVTALTFAALRILWVQKSDPGSDD